MLSKQGAAHVSQADQGGEGMPPRMPQAEEGGAVLCEEGPRHTVQERVHLRVIPVASLQSYHVEGVPVPLAAFVRESHHRLYIFPFRCPFRFDGPCQ